MTIESTLLRGTLLTVVLLASPLAAQAQSAPAAPAAPPAQTGVQAAPAAQPVAQSTAPAQPTAQPTAPAQAPGQQPYATPPGYAPQAYPPGYAPQAYPPGYAPQAYPPGYAPQAYPPGYAYPPPQAYPALPPPPRRDPSFLNATVAVGLGIPYGVLGVGATLGFDYLSLIVGSGTTVVGGTGYAAGLRLHVTDTSNKYRPHLTAVYGTTAAYKISGSYSESGTLNGFAFYAGLDHDVGDPGDWFLTYGIGYITHEALPQILQDNDVDTGSPIKAKFAIGYRFGGK